MISQTISHQHAKSFHEKASLSQVGFVVSVEWSSMELLRLCRHPSIRTLCGAIFRSVQVARPQFSRQTIRLQSVFPPACRDNKK
jgi:hypothetical protein